MKKLSFFGLFLNDMLYNNFMKLLDIIPFKVKLFILLLIASLGFGLISYISYTNTNQLKSRLDYTYFGNFLPILKLKEIIYLYEASVSSTLYKNSHFVYSDAYSYKLLKKANKDILENWNAYKNIYKSDEEKAYVDYANDKIIDLSNDIKHIYVSKSIKKISIKDITYKITSTKKILQKLIDYELEVAKATRADVNRQYQQAINKIFSIAIAVTVIAFIIFIPLLKNIEQNQKRLQHLTQKLKSISIKDPMTKLYNRRYFDHISKKILLNAARYEKNIAFMMMDIDFFKQYNDTYGHQAGDETIKAVGLVLENAVKRANDYAFRLGGEEFGVLLYDTDEDQSKKIATNIKNSVEKLHIPHEKNKASRYVTISIGVVIKKIDRSSLKEDTIDNIIKLSDEKLYKAKESGRNQIFL